MVSCTYCGFLSLRGKDGDFIEVDEQYRTTTLPHPDAAAYQAISESKLGLPLCFMRKVDLSVEIFHQPEWGTANQVAVLKTVTAKRDCDGWTQWQQGFTPKEHREMLDRQWMIDSQRDREDKDREWRENQRKDDLAWREKQESKADRRHRNELWVIGGVVTAALVIGSIVAAIVERGYFWPIWKLTQ